MSKFEFLMMIASVVVAVGLSEIVAGWGRLLRSDNPSIKFDWIHIGFSLIFLLGFINYWTGMWSYHPLELKYTGQIAFLVLPSLFIVLAAYAISPAVPESGPLDCRDYYLRKRKAIWFSWGTFVLSSQVADRVIAGLDTFSINGLLIFLPMALVAFVLGVTSRSWVHASVLVVFSGLTLLNQFTDVSGLDDVFIRE